MEKSFFLPCKVPVLVLSDHIDTERCLVSFQLARDHFSWVVCFVWAGVKSYPDLVLIKQANTSPGDNVVLVYLSVNPGAGLVGLLRE